jgi:tripartite-type tricarboxylate transporter receptor subunit TctC
LKGLIGWLKANPGKASAGTTGPGGVGHVIGVFFQQETGTKFEFVPYRGLAPAMQDMIAGQIDIMFDTAANSMPQVRSGNAKGFAVTAETRLAVAPDLPTADEAGVPGFYMSNWRGLWSPKGTPADVIVKLNGSPQCDGRSGRPQAAHRARARASATGAAHTGGSGGAAVLDNVLRIS